MSDDRSTFEVTRARLEDIVVQARRKDVSLEQSLDLLEEAVRLVNQCNDLIDQTSFRPSVPEGEAQSASEIEPAAASEAAGGADAAVSDADDAGTDEAESASETFEEQGDVVEFADTFVELSEVEFVIEDDERE